MQFLEEDRQSDIYASNPAAPHAETKKGWILVAQGNESTFLASTDSSTLKRHGSGQQIYQSQTAAGTYETVFKNGASKIFGIHTFKKNEVIWSVLTNHITSNSSKAVFHKFCLVHF